MVQRINLFFQKGDIIDYSFFTHLVQFAIFLKYLYIFCKLTEPIFSSGIFLIQGHCGVLDLIALVRCLSDICIA